MTDSITCPRCGRTSYHPDDIAAGYCGACHAFTSPRLRNCHCLCGVAHPGAAGICDGERASTRRTVLVMSRWRDDLGGGLGGGVAGWLVDVPLCAPCAAEHDQRAESGVDDETMQPFRDATRAAVRELADDAELPLGLLDPHAAALDEIERHWNEPSS